jgi:hypothetical protein
MVDPDRIITSIVYVGSMIGVILNECLYGHWAIRLVLVIIQMLALCWYTLSLLPGGRKAALFCMKGCCKSATSDL